jgi:predicted phage tail protein
MAGPDRERTQDWLVPEQARPLGDDVNKALKRLDWRIEAVAASVDGCAGLVAAVAEELDRVQEAGLEAASQGKAAAEIAERAAASAAGAHLLAAERSDRVDRAEARMADLTGRVEAALAKLEAGEQATVRRAEQAERDERNLRSFDERADRVIRRLRDLEQAAVAALDRHIPQRPS